MSEDNCPQITPECVVPCFESRFIRVFDLQYAPGKHYYNATRRPKEELVCLKDDETAKSMGPDAVSCVVILENDGQEPRLLLSMEYRYPAGRFLLSVPAGLIDPADRQTENPLFTAAIRELKEETGLEVTEGDTLTVLNPFLYSTPGMSDESNALVKAVLRNKPLTALSQDGAEGSECFDGFELLTRADAVEALRSGRDRFGHYYSVYTYAALCVFAAGL